MPQGRTLRCTSACLPDSVHIQVWKMEVGRVTLYLLDTNIPENQLPQDRGITDSLYGGDTDTRMRQEIVLGIGGSARAQGAGPRAHRLSHERGPLGVPGARADSRSEARAAG